MFFLLLSETEYDSIFTYLLFSRPCVEILLADVETALIFD